MSTALPGRAGSDLLAAVRARLAEDAGPLTTSRLVSAVQACSTALGAAEVLRLTRDLHADLMGAGPLQPLLEQPTVTDVLVNGPASVWVDDGAGLRPVEVHLGDETAVRALAVRLAGVAGRRLDDASPHVDGRLPDGTRLHAVLPPISPSGTHLSLRRPRVAAFDLDQLVRAGTVAAECVPTLRALVRHRVSYLVSGGTGAGKTTMLATLLGLVDAHERVVIVEDVPELSPDHPHVVRLQARRENVEGRGAISLDALVRTALRMRPDRLVVGECRGAEVRELLAALNTGHEGGCGTVHANTAADVPARMQALGALAGMGPAMVDAQLVAGVEVVLHLSLHRSRGGPPVRRLAQVAVLRRDRHGAVLGVPAWSAGPPGQAGIRGPGWRRLAQRLDLGDDQP